MKKDNKDIEKYRHTKGFAGSDSRYGNNGLFFIKCPYTKKKLKVIASDGLGWEHVSVSLDNRIPLWVEMCFIKDLFWDKSEIVIQYHPRESNYVNNHNFCLHMWRPLNENIPEPPSEMVGIK